MKKAILVGAMFALSMATQAFAAAPLNRDLRMAASDLEFRVLGLANAASKVEDMGETEMAADAARMEVWNYKQLVGIYSTKAELEAGLADVTTKLEAVRKAYSDSKALNTNPIVLFAFNDMNSRFDAINKLVSNYGK